MLYQYLNEHTIKPTSGQPIRLPNGAVVSNPTDEHYRAVGYKPVQYDVEPEYDTYTQILVPHYIDGEVILCGWTVADMPEPEPITPPLPTTEERMSAIEEALLALMEV